MLLSMLMLLLLGFLNRRFPLSQKVFDDGEKRKKEKKGCVYIEKGNVEAFRNGKGGVGDWDRLRN